MAHFCYDTYDLWTTTVEDNLNESMEQDSIWIRTASVLCYVMVVSGDAEAKRGV